MTRSLITPDRAVITVQDLGSVDPGGRGLVTAVYDQSFRVVRVRAVATFAPSRIERMMRRIPGIGWLLDQLLDQLLGGQVDERARATTGLKISGVAVGSCDRQPDKIDELPVVPVGTAVTVRVTNVGGRALHARVIVEGSIS